MRALLLSVLAIVGCGRQDFNEKDGGGSDQPDGQVASENNVAFVTSSLHGPLTLGVDLGNADAICAAAAQAGGLPDADYIALVSTPLQAAVRRLDGSRGWVRTDGSPLVDRVQDIETNSTLHTLSLDENGDDVSVGPVITGSDETGGSAEQTCAGWTDANGTYSNGIATRGGTSWLRVGTTSCMEQGHLYCFGVGKTTPLSYTKATGRLAFVSLSAHDGAITSAAADTLCQSEATAAGKAGEFVALLSSLGQAGSSRFDLTGPTWVRFDGVVVANTPLEFIAGKLTAPLNVDSANTYATNYSVWTGGLPTQAATHSCDSWTSTTGSGTYGQTDDSGTPTLATGEASCPEQRHFYCLQK